MNTLQKSKLNGSHICFLLIAVVLAGCPFLLSSTSTIQFVGKCMCYAIVAISLDLIWGYTGMLSLGHGIYFCLGGYCMAMYLRLKESGGNIIDFMQIGGLTELPFFWKPFNSLGAMIVLMLVVPGVLAGVLGYFVFRSRIKGVYFSIITQALTWAAYSLIIANSKYTGGNNGITDFPSIFGSTRGPANKGNLVTLFMVTLVVLVLVYILANYLVKSKFGKLLIAIRDGENRTYFSGYQVSRYKTFVYPSPLAAAFSMSLKQLSIKNLFSISNSLAIISSFTFVISFCFLDIISCFSKPCFVISLISSIDFIYYFSPFFTNFHCPL